MFPENNNKKIAQGMGSTRSVRRATRYEKARQDVGLFYLYYQFISTYLACLLNHYNLLDQDYFQLTWLHHEHLL